MRFNGKNKFPVTKSHETETFSSTNPFCNVGLCCTIPKRKRVQDLKYMGLYVFKSRRYIGENGQLHSRAVSMLYEMSPMANGRMLPSHTNGHKETHHMPRLDWRSRAGARVCACVRKAQLDGAWLGSFYVITDVISRNLWSRT
jgi:hypothetical protein